jgi:DNA-binding response OmpR family regulator
VRRVRERGLECKILVLSAHLSSENRAAYAALGVDGMMPKPFDLFQLRDMIGRIMDGRPPLVPQQTDPLQLSRTNVCNLLKLGLSEEDAPKELDR